jgi:hypothetical protein
LTENLKPAYIFRSNGIFQEERTIGLDRFAQLDGLVGGWPLVYEVNESYVEPNLRAYVVEHLNGRVLAMPAAAAARSAFRMSRRFIVILPI